MKRLVDTIAIVTALAIVQGCTQLPKIKEKIAMTTTHPVDSRVVAEASHNHHSAHSADHDHTQASSSLSAQVKLTTSGKVIPNTPASLLINVQDSQGNAIAHFDSFQEQVMHLIAVSDDLQVFQHLHPIHQGNGQFEIKARFPQSGSYTLFSDYKPARQAEQVSVLKLRVAGNPVSTTPINWRRTKTFGQTVVSFAPTKVTIKSGEAITLRFGLYDATSDQPVTDLQPYLGEKGHLVILRQSSGLTREDYIHAHAVQNTPVNQVHFVTSFPQPGKYKLWGQFNRNGEIITADYWIEVV